ncbi:MAG: hypothetical protein EXR85_09375 [Xanthomonadales bacterium]|nr:hypothetical protein [Xanthomonadales bacterium]
MNTTLNLPFYRAINPRQVVKWTIYILLLLNWGLYIAEDWQTALHTLGESSTFLDWTSAFSTSLDSAAWFGLLFMWELETYALSDEAYTPFIGWTFLAVRGICYVFLAHTVLSRAETIYELSDLQPSPGITSLCQLANQEISFAYNVDYTRIDDSNCHSLSAGTEFYPIEDTAVTDKPGLSVERWNTIVDLEDAIVWLLIMLTIEIAIWLQDREITGGPAMFVSHLGKVFYAVLFAHTAYWAWGEHWLYFWDQLLWIGGFFAIEMNVSEWRKHIEKHYAKLKEIALASANAKRVT